MDHVITVRDIVHWSLMALFIASLLGVAMFWLIAIGGAMSDLPQSGQGNWGVWALAISVLIPIALFTGWWMT